MQKLFAYYVIIEKEPLFPWKIEGTYIDEHREAATSPEGRQWWNENRQRYFASLKAGATYESH